MQRLEHKYFILCPEERKIIAKRLIDLITTEEETNSILSRAFTEWNCHSIHQWPIVVDVENISNSLLNQTKNLKSFVYKECQNNRKEIKFDDDIRMNVDSCDCIINHFLLRDQILFLTSIILKSFHCFSPIHLEFDC